MKKLLKYKNYLIVTIIAIAIFVFYLKIEKLYPFSDIAPYRVDSFSQYQIFLYNYLTKIKTHLLDSYSFNIGLGTPFAFNYIYYLSSPLNFIALPFSKIENIFMVLLLVRLSLTVIFSKFYFKKKTNSESISNILALIYCFSGWFAVYYDHNIWFDIFMIFPLFQYGLEQLLERKKIYIYIFTLAFMIISNFYICFMICLYTLVYFFIYHIFFNKDKYINKLKSFWLIALATILAFLLSSFHIYLTYTSFLKIGISTEYNEWLYELKFFQGIAALFPGQTLLSPYGEGTSIPNLYVSIFIIINFIYFFINKNIKIKTKIIVALLILAITFMIFSPHANILINGSHIPFGFNYRYSFIISFLIILIAVYNLNNKDYNLIKTLIISILLLISIIVLWKFKYFELNNLILNICSILIYTIIIILLNNNKYQKYFLLFVIPLEMLVGLLFSYNNNITYKTDDAYKLSYEYNLEEFKKVKEYRTWNTKDHEDLTLNQNLITAHSSTPYKKSLYVLKSFGYSTNLISGILFTETNKINSMIFNVKGDYYLPKLYAVNNDLFNEHDSKNAIEKQINFIKATSGVENILEEIPYNIIDKYNYEYQITEDTEYTILLINSVEKIEKNNKEVNYLVFHDSISTDKFKKGDTLKIQASYANSFPIRLFKINEDKLKEAHQIYQEHQINYTYYSDTLMEGTIDVGKNQFIFTSIVYDPDWYVYIDGKEAKTGEILGGLLAIQCPEGHHEIKLEYKPKYTIAIIINILTLIGLIISMFITKKKNNLS